MSAHRTSPGTASPPPTTAARFRPSLLDRLTDDAPELRVDPPEARGASPAQLREAVRRDLAHLLNATQLTTVRDLGPFPEVARSTLNFGIPDLAGRPASSVDRADLARRVRQAVLDFEPRLLGRSLRVEGTVSPEGSGTNALRLDIEADLACPPAPVHLRLQADLSLEDGEARVVERSAG